MPKQKDLKRLIRSRMKKTGEAYTAARLQIVRNNEPLAARPRIVSNDEPPTARPKIIDDDEPSPAAFAGIAGMSDAAVKKQTGRNWTEWVRTLDQVQADRKSHREIAAHVSSLGIPGWWSQTVTVGYERIRGLRERQQRRDGAYEAGKSRTFSVPVERLFRAFADGRIRRRWLNVEIVIRHETPPKRMRILWPDETSVQLAFTAKGDTKSVVAVQHGKLRDRAAVDAMKKTWSEYFDRLEEVLA